MDPEMRRDREIASIILCGGRGTRMGTASIHKVCFEVGGKPVVLHALERYKALGINPNIVVTGHLTENVMETVSGEFDDCAYAFQREPLGTGDAAKCGVRVLEQFKFSGDVLVVAGDKFIEPRALEKLIGEYRESGADLAFLVNTKTPNTTSGRIFFTAGSKKPLNFEYWDLKRAEVWEEINGLFEAGKNPRTEELRDLVSSRISDTAKAARIFPEIFSDGDVDPKGLAQIARANSKVRAGDLEFSPSEVEENSNLINVSVYLVRSQVLRDIIGEIKPQNAQGEEYLTDIINIASLQREDLRVLPVRTESNDDVLAFNTPGELLEIEEYYEEKIRRRETSRDFLKPIDDWVTLFEKRPPQLENLLRDIYGTDGDLIKSKIQSYLQVLGEFRDTFGRKDVLIVRTPGRINLMGRHVDHQGGDVNMVAIHREILLVASPREDDEFVVHNMIRDVHAPKSISTSQLLSNIQWDDWFEFLNKQETVSSVRDPRGDWGNYLKAAILRLQFFNKKAKLRGMNCVVHGDIPPAAGLSSSSALIVAIAEAIVALNGLDIEVREFIDLCGEGEWFVGTRGGSSDHAAIKCSLQGCVTRIGFFPFLIKDQIPFPHGHALIVVNSKIQARKSGPELLRFNEKVLAYEIGREIIKRRFPEFAPRIKHLRDVNPRTLGTSQAKIYDIFQSLPRELEFGEATEYIPAEKFQQLKEKFPNVPLNHTIPVRGVVVYGVAECERSGRIQALLRRGEFDKLGRLMSISHDGDRVVRGDAAHEPDYSDEWIRRCIDDLSSEDPERVENGQLYNQPGHYACSTPEIDFLVDLARVQDGVLGAQISGAGLGGCVMVLARESSAGVILDELLRGYGARWGIRGEGFVVQFVQGSSVLKFP
ncbi:MAG: NTP transferase domain-containing protein [Promethearchaeota archaeon]